MKNLLLCLTFLVFQAPAIVLCMQAAQTDVAVDLSDLSIVVADALATDAPIVPGVEAKGPMPHGHLGMPTFAHRTASHVTERLKAHYKDEFIAVLQKGDVKTALAYLAKVPERAPTITPQIAIADFLSTVELWIRFRTGIMDYVLQYTDSLELLQLLQRNSVKVKGLGNIFFQSPGNYATEILTAWAKDYSQEIIEWLIAQDHCILLPEAGAEINKASVNATVSILAKALRSHINYTNNRDPGLSARRREMAERIIALYELK